MKRIQKQAIEHCDRMIAWVKTKPEDGSPDFDLMKSEIDESYGADYCPYCVKYELVCDTCELRGKYPIGIECCHRLYYAIWDAKTWKQWIERAKKVREYIRDNG